MQLDFILIPEKSMMHELARCVSSNITLESQLGSRQSAASEPRLKFSDLGFFKGWGCRGITIFVTSNSVIFLCKYFLKS